MPDNDESVAVFHTYEEYKAAFFPAEEDQPETDKPESPFEFGASLARESLAAAGVAGILARH